MHRPEGACSGEERGKAPGLGEELRTARSVQSHSTRRTVQSTPGGTPAISILQSIAERGEGFICIPSRPIGTIEQFRSL